jgi:hypothetical protein
MANLAELYAFDKSAFEDGVWIDIGHGISVKVRSPQSAHSKAIRKKLEAPYVALTRGGKDLPDDIAETILIKQMAQSLIIDWKGIEDADKNSVPANPETIEKALRDFQFFREDVAAVIAQRDTYKSQVTELDLGN